MDTLKKWGFWILIIIGFWIFSDLLINIGLNSSYKQMSQASNSKMPSNIQILQSESTNINGRISGIISNNGDEDISNKLLKVDLYNEKGNLVGENYVEIPEVEKDGQFPFTLNFQANDVKSYLLSIVDKREDESLNIPSFKLTGTLGESFLLGLVLSLAFGFLG